LNSYTVGAYKKSGSRCLFSLENVWRPTFVYVIFYEMPEDDHIQWPKHVAVGHRLK